MDCQYKLDYKIISKRIKNARKHANLTQAELAEKINISTNSIAKLETNLTTASLQTVINIANALNIDVNYLLLDEKAENQEGTGRDIFFDSLISRLSQKDKDLIIHIINGLKTYNEE